MFKKVLSVFPFDELKLLVWFEGGESKVYDVSPLLKKWEPFKALEDESLFRKVKVDAGGYGVSWNDEVDLACNELYANGVSLNVISDEKARVTYGVVSARKACGMSQKRLSEVSGVQQPVIARAELGSTSPQLDTLLKILMPMGKTLAIVDYDPHNVEELLA